MYWCCFCLRACTTCSTICSTGCCTTWGTWTRSFPLHTICRKQKEEYSWLDFWPPRPSAQSGPAPKRRIDVDAIAQFFGSLRPTRCHVIPRKYVAELLRLISLSSRLRNLLLFNHFLHGRNLHDLSQRGKSANRFSTATLEILLPKIPVTYHWHFSKTTILSVLDLLLHLTSHNLLLALHGDLCTLVMSHVCHRCLSSVSAAANKHRMWNMSNMIEYVSNMCWTLLSYAFHSAVT